MGGKKLDSYEGNHEFYVKNGFEPVSWVKFDEQYAPHDWAKGRDDAENIIFYKYTGRKNTITKDDFFKKVKPSADYDTPMKTRDASLRRKKK